MKFLKITTIILFLLTVALVSTHSLDSINQDIGRHLKTGQIIWQTREVPKINLFSFTEPNHPFINHHWLSEVIFYLLSLFVGLKGLIVLKVVLITTAFGIILFFLLPLTKFWTLSLSMILGLLVFVERTDVRPEIFSYLFLAIFLVLLLRAKYKNDYRWFWVLPIIQIFWTNVHIYFALGPGLLFLFFIDRLIHERDKKNLKKIGAILIITVLATLLNPNFIKGALTPFTILNGYGYSIVENQSVVFLSNYGILGKQISIFEFSIVVLILSFILVIMSGRAKIIFESLVAVFFTVMAIMMLRNFGIYGLTFAAIVPLNLSAWQIKGGSNKKLIIAAHVLAVVGFSFWVFSITNNSFFRIMDKGQSFGLSVPRGAQGGVEFVKQNKITGPVFNNFDVGSFLIWKLYPVPASSTGYGTSPEFRVFVDGRPEAYSVDFFENIYKPMQEDPVAWKKYSELYGINYVFFDPKDATPWAQTFLQNKLRDPDWPLVYLDQDAIIFLKKTFDNKKIIEKFQIKNPAN